MLNEKMELVGAVEIAEDVQDKLKTVGVRGLDFNKAKELGVFQRIGNLLTVMHATMSASNMIYGHASDIMSELHGRRNEIAREMNLFEKSYERFLNFWTGYYATGENCQEVRRETDNLYHRIMEWAQLPEHWNIGDKQRKDDANETIAIRIELDNTVYTLRNAAVDVETSVENENWGVLCYDMSVNRQTVVHTDIDKASALMVARRLSAEAHSKIYTAAVIRDVEEKRTEVMPFRSFMDDVAVGDIMKVVV